MNYIRRNWEPLIILLALLLGLALGARAIFAESGITIVHTGETGILQWNPATHEEVRQELPDGNMQTIVRPKDNDHQREDAAVVARPGETRADADWAGESL